MAEFNYFSRYDGIYAKVKVVRRNFQYRIENKIRFPSRLK